MTTKKFNSVLCALGLVAAFACTEEIAPVAPEVPEVTVPENLVEMTITASQDDTKSTFDGKKIGWELTDVVAVYDGVDKREFTVTSIDEQTGAATLKGYVDADATAFQAVYPYSAAGDKLPADGKINISVPATQKLVEGAVVAPGALVSVGEILEGNISFKNVVSLLKVKVTEEMTSVSVKGVKYENIAGDATATVAAVTSEGGAANIVLKPVGEKFVAGDYYIALLPTAFADGFTVAYRRESGLAVLKSGASVEFLANGGFDVTGKDLSTLTWLTNPIMSESDLKTYLANQDSYAGEAVSLGQNITLTETWTPAVLTGNLEGAGYTISGLDVTVADAGTHGAMFTVIDTDASLKNVTVEGTVSLSTSAKTSYAGLAGELKGTMYKVINKASVTAASTGSSRCYLGGLVGMLNGGSMVECQNDGDVTMDATSCVSFMGGLVGGIYPAGLVQNSVNTGTVTSNSSKVEGLGGIIGIQQAGTVEGCTNSGTLALESGAGNSYVGGITGYVQNQSTAKLMVSNCINKGIVGNFTTPKAVGGICGVIHRYCKASTEINGCKNETELAATITKSEFYLGGIVGRMANPGDASAIGAHVNYIKNCESAGNVSLTKDGTNESSAMCVGGVLGVMLGEVEMTGNKTTAQTVALVDANSKNLVDFVGGIVAKGDDTHKLTISNNINKAAVSCNVKEKNIELVVGGIIGYAPGTVISSNNINFGNVTAANADGSNSNAYAGGVVGVANLAADEEITLTSDKSFGHISSSSARAGLIVGISRYSGYGTITMTSCVVGGKLNDPLNKYVDMEITAENFDDNKNMLMSYWKTATTTFNNSDTTFGKASDYDK
ncbi:MAG: hypothetical protein J6J25_09965 [Bacteroidales bacterium]|nr:hypothetical protein [Bacteroidales bacterium]